MFTELRFKWPLMFTNSKQLIYQKCRFISQFNCKNFQITTIKDIQTRSEGINTKLISGGWIHCIYICKGLQKQSTNFMTQLGVHHKGTLPSCCFNSLWLRPLGIGRLFPPHVTVGIFLGGFIHRISVKSDNNVPLLGQMPKWRGFRLHRAARGVTLSFDLFSL